MKLKFRGYGNPIIAGTISDYVAGGGAGSFTVGNIYSTDKFMLFGRANIHEILEGHSKPDGMFIDDNGLSMWEETIFFDIVED